MLGPSGQQGRQAGRRFQGVVELSEQAQNGDLRRTGSWALNRFAAVTTSDAQLPLHNGATETLAKVKGHNPRQAGTRLCHTDQASSIGLACLAR